MKLLLAGPGTGKTTRIKSLIEENFPNAQRIIVLSFTNATVNDLSAKFSSYTNVSCSTLHSFALKFNHLPDLHILTNEEKSIIVNLSKKLLIEYSTLCKFLRCIDFDSMITECISFAKANPEYVKMKLSSLDLLIVDEYQDFNPHEQDFVMILKDYAKETFILGDDDQSIYGFKDADPDGIISLNTIPEVGKIRHENICYRCPDKVVDVSKTLIEKNNRRVKKEWNKSGKPGEVSITQYKNQKETSANIAELSTKIQERDNGASILILSPVGFAAKAVKDEFDARRIAYVDFWNNDIEEETLKEVWWLNLIYGNHKLLFILFLLKYLKLLNKKVTESLKEKFSTNFDEKDLVLQLIESSPFPKAMADFVFTSPAFDGLITIDASFEKYREHIDFNDIAKSVNELLKTMTKPKDFIKGAINLMSIHKSKGLESDYVIINGLVNGILPNETKGIDTLEAQRRLLFVGMTRAIKELYLISTVEWESADSYKVDHSQFKYNYRTKKVQARTSMYIEDITE